MSKTTPPKDQYRCPQCDRRLASAAAALGCCNTDPSASDLPITETAERPHSGEDRDADPDADLDLDPDADRVTLEVGADRAVWPDDIKQYPIWTLWNGRDKMPIAPWATQYYPASKALEKGWCHDEDLEEVEGHSGRFWQRPPFFPARWGGDVGRRGDPSERPERSFEEVSTLLGIAPGIVAESYGADRSRAPDRLLPTIILPQDPAETFDLDEEAGEPRLMYVDLDDVRDPDTGEVSAEVADIVDAIDSYTEVSRSGEGLHIICWATLPRDVIGKERLIEDLEVEGSVEVYDQRRFLGMTGKHVSGTPTEVTKAQGAIDALAVSYTSEETQQRAAERDRGRGSSRSTYNLEDAAQRGTSSVLDASSDDGRADRRNPYYDLDIRPIARTGHLDTHGDCTGAEWSGPHPSHGSKKSDLEECTNFTVDTHSGTWFCRWHGSKGGGIHLIAVLEDIVSCEWCDTLTDAQLLLACLYARDRYTDGDLDGETPPIRALGAMLRLAGCAGAPDEGETRIRKNLKSIAQRLYDNASVDEVEERVR